MHPGPWRWQRDPREFLSSLLGAKTQAEWAAFTKKYRAEMATPEHAHLIELLAALSHQSNFSVGCYCEEEAHCHRSVLRELLAGKGAALDGGT